MDALKSLDDRMSPELANMLALSFVSFGILNLLATFSKIRTWWAFSVLRLSSSAAFFKELIRSAQPSSIHDTARRRHSTHLTQPTRFPFEIFEIVRFYQASQMVLITPRNMHDGLESCKGLEDVSNPDIVGSGVRLSMYLLFFAVFASLFIGSFHSGPSGTKELGVATLVNLVSLAINILKVNVGDLTPTDIFVIIVMVDTHCVTLSATLSSKDVLASRFYVWLAVLGQVIAWAAVLCTDIRYVGPGLSSTQPKPEHCMKDLWFDFIITPGKQSAERPFRAYWISHSYDLIQSSALALCHTKRFDELEKIDRKHQDAIGTLNENPTAYRRLPSTAFSNWRGFVIYPIMLVVVVERHLSRNEINVGDFREWGQSFTMITCECGVLHWLYVNLPLMMHPFTCIWQGSWITAQDPILPTNIMRSIAVGVPPSLVGEENYKLLTADKPE